MSPLKKVTIQTRRGLLLLVVGLAFLALPTAAWVLSTQADDNCERIHRIVSVGASIIDGRDRLANQLELGLITRRQYKDGLQATERALRTWRTADCVS